MFVTTTEYSISGDDSQTLNTLTMTPNTGSSDLKTLSTVSDINAPNKNNQLVFMNQPLSWWVSSLKSGAVYYTPYSNNVNWSYKDPSGSLYHIDISISDLVIPNKTQSVTRIASSMSTVITYEPKFGISRVDTHTM